MSLDRLGRRMRRFSVAFKTEILRQLNIGERDIAEVCNVYDLNYSTVLQWINKAFASNSYRHNLYSNDRTKIQLFKFGYGLWLQKYLGLVLIS